MDEALLNKAMEDRITTQDKDKPHRNHRPALMLELKAIGGGVFQCEYLRHRRLVKVFYPVCVWVHRGDID